MSAFVLVRGESPEAGLQPFEPRKHMRQVADLVGSVFANELDARGRSLVRDMRTAGQLSSVMGGLWDFAVFDDFISGYVWVEDGRVVGNVTLQQAETGGIRWRISNVAVVPHYRRRGIASALMRAALREIGQRNGNWAVLQVRVDNPAARQLYEDLGFSNVCQDGVWKLEVAAKPSPVHPTAAGGGGGSGDLPLLRRLPASAWHSRYEVAQSAHSPLARWAGELRRSSFEVGAAQQLAERVGGLTGVFRVDRWGAWGDEMLLGWVETRSLAWGEYHVLRFAARPDGGGRVERVLVARALHSLAGASPRPVVAEHSGDHSTWVEALEAFGFRPHRVLLTMRRKVGPADLDS